MWIHRDTVKLTVEKRVVQLFDRLSLVDLQSVREVIMTVTWLVAEDRLTSLMMAVFGDSVLPPRNCNNYNGIAYVSAL